MKHKVLQRLHKRSYFLSLIFMLAVLLALMMSGCNQTVNQLEAFPDIPVYPESTQFKRLDGVVAFMVQQKNASYQQIVEFYKMNLEEKEWQLTDDYEGAMFFEKNGQKVMITVDSNATAREDIQVTISEVK